MSKSDLSKLYRKQSDIEHVLHNPDTYIGSIELVKEQLFLHVDGRIQLLPIDFIGGLYKLFDEAITNARDHYIRMNEKIKSADIKSADIKSYPVCKIDIHVNKTTGEISILNDGNGIDVEIHPEYEIYIPELIFGHLRTSTNYDKEEKKIVGGKNGFGVKLIFAWSTYGKIETYDSVRGLKYTQEFKNNLSEILPPIIEKPKKIEKFYGLKAGTPFTKITFIPDYNRFGIDGLNNQFGDNLISLFKKRSYDIAAFVGKTRVYFNDELIPINTFEQLVNLYLINDCESPKSSIKQIYESANERWEYSVCLAHDGLKNNISYVNGICTHKGGKHVEYIINQITKKIIEVIETKKKMKISPNIVKERLCIFLRCDIENPSFDSQTKEYLTTPYSKFGSNCIISEAFIQKVLKMGIMDIVCSISEIKGIAELDKVAKKSDGKKSRKIYGIPKLIDANWAGTEKSNLCSLILCEGDSAKAGVISGLTSEMRNVFGIFPLKGKLLNVRGESMEKILSNEEIANLKKILGLANKAVYNIADIRKLRYGKVLILTDADVDGSHIKGLCINMFDVLWPSLLQVGGFIGYMNTPILKARKGVKELLFYNEGEYNIWKESEISIHQWSIKYYKGLGTSTGKEFREYFENNKIVHFSHTTQSCDCIDMMFNKKRPDDRKQFLLNYTGIDDPNNIMDTALTSVSYEEFINKELVIFSKYDCERSIPNIMDGFKISNRKILYVMLKKNITSEMKVAQLGALIAQVSSYHHGEISLIGAIIGMAQDFVGSNNINLLEPKGQFGTRRQGGKDHASERYIFTNMSPITRKIFIESDDHILKYLDDDGTPVEPMYYAPIIPMCIVNSMSGIGTGFSTEILGYNPQEIIKYLQFKLHDGIYPNIDKLLIPYYKNFKGNIIPLGDKFLILGNYTKLDKNRIHITELPIGLYTEDFRKILDTLMGEGIEKPTASTKEKKSTKKETIIVKDYDDNSDDKNIDFVITLCDGLLDELESKIDKTKGINLVYKTFHLATTGSTSNIHLFDARGILKKYNNIIEIIDEYFITRLELYQVRKNYLIDKLTNELIVIENKVRFIRELLSKPKPTINLCNMEDDAVYKLLSDKEYILIDGNYNYLIGLPMYSVTKKKVIELENKFESKKIELEDIKASTIENMWLHELEELNIELAKELAKELNESAHIKDNSIKKNVKSKKNKITK
jgi:DNA topoisomerase-2